MTALGNVMALVRNLDEREPVEASRDLEPTGVFPPGAGDASSLGEVLAFIREIQGDSLRELIDSLPPVKRRVAAMAPDRADPRPAQAALSAACACASLIQKAITRRHP